jgi:hypothetical protein
MLGFVTGSAVTASVDPARAAKRGCVRKRCDEEGGFTCRERWSCAPDRSGTEASGCVPDPCEESGRCADDTTHVCEATSANPRPAGSDVHGCVVRNCEEGHSCVFMRNGENFSYCDFSAKTADDYGCAVDSCEEHPGVCGTGYVCDPAYREMDRMGCRALGCRDPGGPVCVGGASCVLMCESSPIYRCALPIPGQAGAGGASGANGSPRVIILGGNGGAATGGQVAATGGASGSGCIASEGGGSSGADPMTGRGMCVDRE